MQIAVHIKRVGLEFLAALKPALAQSFFFIFKLTYKCYDSFEFISILK